MAGQGYKQFAVGEVLTASDVNGYLMDQSVLVFADSSARTSAIGTATEGMVSYLSDTDSVEVYDGSSWVGVGLPLGTATPTDGQFLSFATATSTWEPVDTPIALGTATPTDGQVLAFGTATSTWNPTDQLAGIGSNVVQTVKTDTFTRSSTSFGSVTGLSVSITPSSATSKVLVFAQYTIANTGGINWGASSRLVRDGTAIYRADSASNRIRASYGWLVETTAEIMPVTLVYLDSPNTTSSTTYSVQVSTGQGQTVVVNRSGSDSDFTYESRSVSSITAIEVAA